MQSSQHRAKSLKGSGKKVAGNGMPENVKVPEKFGDQVTVDHIITKDGEESVDSETVALVCYDRHTKFLPSFLAVSKDAEQTQGALSSFFGDEKPRFCTATMRKR